MKSASITLALVTGLAFTSPSRGSEESEALAAWASVLHSYVEEEGQVDFEGLSRDSADLRRFVEYLGKIAPGSHPEAFTSRNAVLAYHVNAYNALAMYGVIERGIPDDFQSIFKRIGFFKNQEFLIGGRRISLHDYENEVIRPLGEARIHFALNCMVRDCPRLPRTPFRAQTLDQQLDAAAREFFSSEKHVRVDAGTRTVWVSSILKFYTRDFVNELESDSLLEYMNQYREDPLPQNYRLRFMRYDWTVNQAPAR